MLNILPVRAFSDNYIWLVRAPDGGPQVVAVDPGDPAPVIAALESHGLTLAGILATHHHWDHTNGIVPLLEHYDVPVFAPADEKAPVAGCSDAVRRGDRAQFADLGLEFQVLDIPGHTAGHVAFYGHGAVFCGDTLFSAGCGRLFEGTPAQMLKSLSTLAALPGGTQVYCGHEYTQANLQFAAAVEPGNSAIDAHREHVAGLRSANRPSLPSSMALEMQINPFLRCHKPDVRRAAEAHAGEPLADDIAVFAAIRRWKDHF